MNLGQIKRNWMPFKGNSNSNAGEFTDNRIDVMLGEREKLAVRGHEASAREGYMPKEEILPHRVVLHGALAVVCGLWMPIAFLGCDSNESANSSSPPDSSPTNVTNYAFKDQ